MVKYGEGRRRDYMLSEDSYVLESKVQTEIKSPTEMEVFFAPPVPDIQGYGPLPTIQRRVNDNILIEPTK